MPAARQIALASLRRRLERKQRDNIARIGMKHLLLRRVCRRSDLVRVDCRRQVLDVREHHVGGLAVKGAVLAAAGRRDVRGEAGVDDDVFLARVPLDGDAANDFEAVTVVDLLGDLAQSGV